MSTNTHRIITISPDTVASYKARTPIDQRIHSVVLWTDALPGLTGSISHYDACDRDENHIDAGVPYDFLMEACVHADNQGAIPGTIVQDNWVY